MSPVLVNGRELGVESNGLFTDANTDPIAGGRLWPEAALTWNALRVAYVADGGRADDFVPAGPNSSSRSRAYQDYVWDLYLHHDGNPAAPPYTSNHGWGIAVDVKTQAAAAWLLAHAAEFGWSHDEGARVGEWWHMSYVGASAAQLRQARRMTHPLMVLTKGERRNLRRYTSLRRKRQRQGGKLRSDRDRRRIRVLHGKLVKQRKGVWLAGHTHGWEHAHRRQRYELLLKATADNNSKENTK